MPTNPADPIHPDEPIAIVGAGCVLPDAPDVETFWNNLLAGRSSIREVPKDRWDPELFFSEDKKAADKTYAKIGGFIVDESFDGLAYRMPPNVVAQVDASQRWALTATRQALHDAGLATGLRGDEGRDFDRERCAVILGNAMGGEIQKQVSKRLYWPEVEAALRADPDFQALPDSRRDAVIARVEESFKGKTNPVTEDTMPGHLSNVAAGRIANAFDLGGKNFTTDAACASSLAALDAAMDSLRRGESDHVVWGGSDRSMDVTAYIQFSKIGALSPDGSRPFDEAANGFVMGEGCAMFVLKRLTDALADGDKVYATIRGIGASSDGKGKGITAPNPVGQVRAVRRAYQSAGIDPATIGYLEAHGTSTPVGDPTELESVIQAFQETGAQAAKGSIAVGSVKSNIGHLKAAAGAAGILKAVLCLHHGRIPPSLNVERLNPRIQWDSSPFTVAREAMDFPRRGDHPRRAAVSSFGFGGTNFHVVLEEATGSYPADLAAPQVEVNMPHQAVDHLDPDVLVVDAAQLDRVAALASDASAFEQERSAITAAGRQAATRVACVAPDAATAAKRLSMALRARDDPQGAGRLAFQQGVFFGGQGAPAGKTAFLFPGQGTQYVNMLRDLQHEPEVKATFAEADEALRDVIGCDLTSVIWPDPDTPENQAASNERLRLTEFTQPAVLAADVALLRILKRWGIDADVVAGHSLGEYAALVAADVLSFKDALHAVAARGREMASVQVPDLGKMASVSADWERVHAAIQDVAGYVIPANKNCPSQTVIAGASDAVVSAMKACQEQGLQVMELPVSAAFHSKIVAPASEPLRRVLGRLDFQAPRIRVISNVGAEPYPDDPEAIRDNLARQVASPVEWIGILERMYDEGVRNFIEVGPKKALTGFAQDTLGGRGDAMAICSNHPKRGGRAHLQDLNAYLAAQGLLATPTAQAQASSTPSVQTKVPQVTISGISVGLPGRDKEVFAEDNFDRIIRGDNLIDAVPAEEQQRLVGKHITRLRKGDDGSADFEAISDVGQVIRLAGQAGHFDPTEFGIPSDLAEALDRTTQYAMAAGIEALRDAGIPLVQTWKTTSTGSRLPGPWRLPAEMRDDTGIIFASAFPGHDALLREVERVREGGEFDRRFLFHVLSMGHSQFAQFIGARGPNTQVNAACASTTQAIAIAEDWVKTGRARRVIVVGADDVTSDAMFQWIGAGFLAAGAATTKDDVAEAALPFDRRRHGMIVGMGAVGLIIEAEDSVAARGMRPIAKLLATRVSNSAFHGSRLDVDHIASEMRDLVAASNLDPATIAPATVFMSHETYTPARGGSASAEIHALRAAFGGAANQVVVANTKGFTGHPQGAGVEDAIALKCLQRGRTPPIANFRDADPELGDLTLSDGGEVNARYALRLAAGFGSQVAMTLTELVAREDERIADNAQYQAWLDDVAGSNGASLVVKDRQLRVVVDADVHQGTTQAAVPPVASPAPVAKPVEAAAPAVAQAAAPVDVLKRLTDLVAEKTGYPVELLEPDLDMEADLGIDTVKQAELFGLIREAYDVPLADGLQIKDYPTLRAVADYIASQASGASSNVDSAASPAEIATEPASTPTGSADGGEVLAKLTGLVAEKTGYPVELLEPDLDMEADLGIDTVKQAELFGLIREAYDVPLADGLQIKDYPTLRAVADYIASQAGGASPADAHVPVVESSQPEPAPAVTPAPTESQVAPRDSAASSDEILAKVTSLVAAQTGYPEELLEPDLDMEADLGIDTVKQAELFGQVREAFGIAPVDGLQLKDYPTLRAVASFAADHQSGTPETQAADVVDDAREDTQPAGVVRRVPVLTPCPLPGDQAEVRRGTLVVVGDFDRAHLDAWRAAGFAPTRHTDQSAVGILCLATEATGHDRAGALFDAAKALPDVDFIVTVTRQGGDHGLSGGDPEMAAVAGLTRALARERDCIVKAIDLADNAPALVVDEVLAGGRHVSVAYGTERTILQVAPDDTMVRDQVPDVAGKTLVVSGGAQGITVPILEALAPQGPNLLLLGRTVVDKDAATWAAWNDDDWATERQRIMDDLKQQGLKVTPVAVQKELDAKQKQADVHANLQRLKAAGANVLYSAVDVTDADGVADAVSWARERFGAIHGVLHAAGLEISKDIASKDRRQFDLVYGVKVQGWQALIEATRDDILDLVAGFSSVAATFGNLGQTDYAAANAWLESAVQREARERDCTGWTIAWGPWGDVGMATRGSILTIMEQSGVDTIPTPEGVAHCLTQWNRSGHVIVAGRLGDLAGVGIILDRAPTQAAANLTEASSDSASEEVVMHLDAQRFLVDHAIDGVPLLPGVVGLEAFLQAKDQSSGFRDIRFQVPVKRHKPIDAVIAMTGDDVRLTTQFIGPDGKPHGDPRVHFTATYADMDLPAVTVPEEDDTIQACTIYDRFFHGPSFQVLSGARVTADGATGTYRRPVTDEIGERFGAPLTTEALFQLAGLHVMLNEGRQALPSAIGAVAWRPDVDAGRLHVAYKGRHGDHFRFDCYAVDDRGETVVVLEDFDLIDAGPAPEPTLPVLDGVVFATHPVTSDDCDPLWFTDEERRVHADFGVPKRADEWRAGRMAVKKAVATHTGCDPRHVHVDSTDGAPRVTVKGQPLNIGVSITHRAGHAVAALAGDPLGIDLETIEERSQAWLTESFNQQELEALMASSDATLAASCMWAAKEAAFKRVGKGLKASLRDHTVTLDDDGALVRGPLLPGGGYRVAFFQFQGSVLAVSAPAIESKQSLEVSS